MWLDKFSARRLGILTFLLLPLAQTGCHGCGCCYRGADPGLSEAASASLVSAVPNAARSAPGAIASEPSVPVAAAKDQRPYGGQKTCPVTGEALGSMGAPVAVQVGGDTIYVCCKGCAAKVRRNPDFYLAKVRQEREGR